MLSLIVAVLILLFFYLISPFSGGLQVTRNLARLFMIITIVSTFHCLSDHPANSIKRTVKNGNKTLSKRYRVVGLM